MLFFKMNVVEIFKRKTIIKYDQGFSIVSLLIAIFISSISVLSIMKISAVFMENWKDFYLLSTYETLKRNFEQTASSPTSVLSSKDLPGNTEIKECLEFGRCNSMNDYIDFSLANIASGKIISSGSGVKYDIYGDICSSIGVGNCSFEMKSQIKAFCYAAVCEVDKGNDGFAIKYEITMMNTDKGIMEKTEDFVYLKRSQFKNAKKEMGCVEHFAGISQKNEAKCVNHNYDEDKIYIFLP